MSKNNKRDIDVCKILDVVKNLDESVKASILKGERTIFDTLVTGGLNSYIPEAVIDAVIRLYITQGCVNGDITPLMMYDKHLMDAFSGDGTAKQFLYVLFHLSFDKEMYVVAYLEFLIGIAVYGKEKYDVVKILLLCEALYYGLDRYKQIMDSNQEVA